LLGMASAESSRGTDPPQYVQCSLMSAAPPESGPRQKELGAFYTPPAMAKLLVEWAIQTSHDRVLDPGFGGLVFLDAAAQRLEALGCSPDGVGRHLFGIEVDDDAHGTASGNDLEIAPGNLFHGDFFATTPGVEVPLSQAVVGNPPYIRYQGWDGKRARKLAEVAGVRLTRLASSWAPFVVHATAFVAPHGRLAMVLPGEMLHAQYASEVVSFLARSYGRLQLAVFEERVFPGALEEVVLLFADRRGEGRAEGIEVVECRTLDDLTSTMLAQPTVKRARPDGGTKLLAQLLPGSTQDLYESLPSHDRVSLLGQVASVDIGAVTGANDFFLLTDRDAVGLDDRLLRPAVSKAAHVRGARLTTTDIGHLRAQGQRMLMFVAHPGTPNEALSTAQSHLSRGQTAGIHERYKCRVRSPWWSVPLPKHGSPDLFFTYCSNRHPRVALNEAVALHTNTLHGVTAHKREAANELAAGFVNSLTLLSAELIGRSYGGGVLKLEPTEAEALLLPPLGAAHGRLREVDALLREGDLQAVLDLVDPLVLGDGLGLRPAEIKTLRSGAERLRERRRARGSRVAQRPR
jgi:adenine-specific DNA-methyltransferase